MVWLGFTGRHLLTSGLEWLLIVWGIVTGIFLILLFYRSAQTRQENFTVKTLFCVETLHNISVVSKAA